MAHTAQSGFHTPHSGIYSPDCSWSATQFRPLTMWSGWLPIASVLELGFLSTRVYHIYFPFKDFRRGYTILNHSAEDKLTIILDHRLATSALRLYTLQLDYVVTARVLKSRGQQLEPNIFAAVSTNLYSERQWSVVSRLDMLTQIKTQIFYMNTHPSNSPTSSSG